MHKFISYEINQGYGYICFTGGSHQIVEVLKDRLMVNLLDHHFKVLNMIVMNDHTVNEVTYHCPGKGILTTTVHHTIATHEDVEKVYSMLYNKHDHLTCHIIGFNPI